MSKQEENKQEEVEKVQELLNAEHWKVAKLGRKQEEGEELTLEQKLEELEKENEKQKHFARLWESRAKNANSQLEQVLAGEEIAEGSLEKKEEVKIPSSAEEVQELLANERAKIQREYATEFAKTHFSTKIAEVGVDVSEFADAINLEAFLTADNKADVERIENFVKLFTAGTKQEEKKQSWGLTASTRKTDRGSRGLGQFVVNGE